MFRAVSASPQWHEETGVWRWTDTEPVKNITSQFPHAHDDVFTLCIISDQKHSPTILYIQAVVEETVTSFTLVKVAKQTSIQKYRIIMNKI